MDARIKQLVDWIRQTAAPAKGLLIPVSGGSDSALGFYLCQKAFPEKTLAVYAGGRKSLRCLDWFQSVGKVEFVSVPRYSDDKELMRWTKFMSMSRLRNAWLVGSRNRSEDVFGTYSLASRIVTYLPLAGLWKSQVMELSKLVGVPDEILDSSRQADPACGRPQELAEIALESIDLFLRVKANELPAADLKALTAEQVSYLEGIYQRNQFRQSLPIKGPILVP